MNAFILLKKYFNTGSVLVSLLISLTDMLVKDRSFGPIQKVFALLIVFDCFSRSTLIAGKGKQSKL